jgi:hypothetical protein
VRPVYEMERVTPGEDPGDPDTDSIIEAVELKEAGDYREADRALMNLLVADLRWNMGRWLTSLTNLLV